MTGVTCLRTSGDCNTVLTVLKTGYRMVSGISTKDGFRIRFEYASGKAGRNHILTGREFLKVETDESGRVLCVSVNQDGEEVKLVRYRYDDRGDMVETIDALDVSKHFVYSGGTCWYSSPTRGGMSFHWEYEGRGECPLCAYMGRWRRDGIFHPLRQGIYPYP